MLGRVALVRTDVSEELRSVRRFLVIASVVRNSLILVTLLKEALSRFLQEPRCVTSQKTPFFNCKRKLRRECENVDGMKCQKWVCSRNYVNFCARYHRLHRRYCHQPSVTSAAVMEIRTNVFVLCKIVVH
jgi:hypothetical protein